MDETDKKLSLIINMATIFVLLCVLLVALFIYRDNISALLSKKSPDDDTLEMLNAASEPADSNLDLSDSLEETEETTETTEPEIAGPDPDMTNMEWIETIKTPLSDFMLNMFENAIQIPGVRHRIESPPQGRSEEQQYGAVPLSDTIPEPFEYFRNAVFLGDSVTTGFDLYKHKIKFDGMNILENVNVIAVGKFSVYNSLQPITDRSVHPLMDGKQTFAEDIIAKKNVKNIFICLGLNDLTFAKPSNFVIYYSRLIERIKEKNPDKNIVIMSVTPLVHGQENNSLNNDVIAEANNVLLEYAKENGIYFVDYGAAIRDNRNALPSDWSSDGYCHITVAAYERLVEYLLYHPIK